jgi:RNA polymerase sigma-70 factor (ECF subfamily)
LARSDPDRVERFLRHLEPLQGGLETYCRRALRDERELEDALQNTVARAFRDFHLYAEGTNFRAWIFQYLHTEICNRNRKHERARHEPLPSDLGIEETWQLILDEPLAKALLDDPDLVLDRCDQALAEAIRDLPSQESEVFLLRVIGEFRYREIAEILDIPIGSAMGYLARGRLRLRQRLANWAEEQGILKRHSPPG